MNGIKLVSFKQATSIDVVRYEDTDRTYSLRRPADFRSLVLLLQKAGLYSEGDGLSYFPYNMTKPWATNRIRLDTETFAEWSAFDDVATFLPRIWVYPRVDGMSPENPPASAGHAGSPTGDDESVATPSTARRARQYEFRTTLREIDGQKLLRCALPGCAVSFSMSMKQSEAAHIIPNYILDIKRRKSSEVYNSIMSAAEFVRGDIDSPRNGMLLCTGHHTTFDSFQWTVNPSTFTVMVSPEADPDQRVLHGQLLDFSHRPESQRPTAKVWAAYHDHVFRDKAALLRAAARVQE